ncbi:hypothetical protein CDL15_Pgr001743 [Punica granatum]|uniref:Uncharacterized protein n=1 Tax=Punica granatum TaxID=22663 RepID=A0A218XBU7_PUNGR|nr:hypothetical protein CDL15_Pgr001743 [Punica granatum]
MCILKRFTWGIAFFLWWVNNNVPVLEFNIVGFGFKILKLVPYRAGSRYRKKNGIRTRIPLGIGFFATSQKNGGQAVGAAALPQQGGNRHCSPPQGRLEKERAWVTGGEKNPPQRQKGGGGVAATYGDVLFTNSPTTTEHGEIAEGWHGNVVERPANPDVGRKRRNYGGGEP